LLNTGVGSLRLMETSAASQLIAAVSTLQFGTDDLFVSTTNSSSTPGGPWMRGDGNYLVINPGVASDLYLAWDAGNLIRLGRTTLGGSADATVDLGSAGHRWRDIYFAEPTTGDALFPLVTSSGRIMAKNDDFNGTVTIGACTQTFEFGILVSKAGGC
jgi:hypothetical protein